MSVRAKADTVADRVRSWFFACAAAVVASAFATLLFMKTNSDRIALYSGHYHEVQMQAIRNINAQLQVLLNRTQVVEPSDTALPSLTGPKCEPNPMEHVAFVMTLNILWLGLVYAVYMRRDGSKTDSCNSSPIKQPVPPIRPGEPIMEDPIVPREMGVKPRKCASLYG